MKPTITSENKSYWAPFVEPTNRVESVALQGERVIRLTSGREELRQLYADFQNTNNKVVWLYENKDYLKKFDINFEKLVDIHGDS